MKMFTVFYSKCVPSLSNPILTSVTYTMTFPQFEKNNILGKLADISPRINFARLSKKVRFQVSRASRLQYPVTSINNSYLDL